MKRWVEGGRWVGRETWGPYLYILTSIIIGKHMKMLCFQFQQNRTINEEFDFL